MGNSSSISNHISNAQKTGVCQLSNMQIKELPSQLLRLNHNLRSLDLSTNKIEILPEAIGNFTVLKNLNLNNNLLRSLPNSIGKLKKLETLQLSNNSLTSLPSPITNCNSLQTINLKMNRFKKFPIEVTHLKKLDAIDISSNQIKSLPPEISKILAVEININNNQLIGLPENLAECKRLKVFRFEENNIEIKNIPSKILSSSGISLMVFDGNLFTSKAFHDIEGYEEYMKRYTATKRKFD